MSSWRPSPSIPQKKVVALKRADGEPLTRTDIQYDVLYNIFHDTHDVFTDPYPSNDTRPVKVCFRDLYVKTILHSPKATKALKDKMTDSPMFAEDFGMLALLVNVGRVNTTMSFFPEMKTAIRTYHPIPALQRTTGNLQDAPRIKHILKSAVLGSDGALLLSTPADILERVKAGHVPSTTAMNLIFVLANHSVPIGHSHFSQNLDFIDLFIREDVSSLSRAQAFLWLCYHYLESPETDGGYDYDGDGPCNPFVDQRRGDTPSFIFLSQSEVVQENVDSEDEKILSKKLIAQRAEILKVQGVKESNKANGNSSVVRSMVDEEEEEAVHIVHEIKPKGKRAVATSKSSLEAKEKKAATSALRRPILKEEYSEERQVLIPGSGLESDDEDAKVTRAIDPISSNQYPHLQRHYHRQLPSESRRRRGTSSETSEPDHPGHRYSPYQKSLVITVPPVSRQQRGSYRPWAAPTPSRSLLQHAWHVVTTTDPLVDSDEEVGDDHVRHDYVQRLCVINTLRQKEPTPEPELKA